MRISVTVGMVVVGVVAVGVVTVGVVSVGMVAVLDRHVPDAVQADGVEQALQGGQGEGPVLPVAGGVNRNILNPNPR